MLPITTFSTSRTLIFQVPGNIVPHVNGLSPRNCSIEAVYDKKNSDFYIATSKTHSPRMWENWLKGLYISTEQLFLLPREEWNKAVTEIFYFKYKGNWTEANLFEWGEHQNRFSARKLTKRKENNESAVINQIKDRLKADSSLNWFDPIDQELITKEEVPKSLSNRENQMISQLNTWFTRHHLAKIKPAKKRMVIVIIAPATHGKTLLAKLIMAHLAENKVLDIKNTRCRKGMSMRDKLSRGITMNEGLIWDDFKAGHFDFGPPWPESRQRPSVAAGPKASKN